MEFTLKVAVYEDHEDEEMVKILTGMIAEVVYEMGKQNTLEVANGYCAGSYETTVNRNV